MNVTVQILLSGLPADAAPAVNPQAHPQVHPQAGNLSGAAGFSLLLDMAAGGNSPGAAGVAAGSVGVPQPLSAPSFVPAPVPAPQGDAAMLAMEAGEGEKPAAAERSLLPAEGQHRKATLRLPTTALLPPGGRILPGLTAQPEVVAEPQAGDDPAGPGPRLLPSGLFAMPEVVLPGAPEPEPQLLPGLPAEAAVPGEPSQQQEAASLPTGPAAVPSALSQTPAALQAMTPARTDSALSSEARPELPSEGTSLPTRPDRPRSSLAAPAQAVEAARSDSRAPPPQPLAPAEPAPVGHFALRIREAVRGFDKPPVDAAPEAVPALARAEPELETRLHELRAAAAPVVRIAMGEMPAAAPAPTLLAATPLAEAAIAAAPGQAPAAPAFLTAEPPPAEPSLTELVDRLIETRVAARAERNQVDLAHPDFGRITLAVALRGDDRLAIDLPGAPAELRQAVSQALAQQGAMQAGGQSAGQSSGQGSSQASHQQHSHRSDTLAQSASAGGENGGNPQGQHGDPRRNTQGPENARLSIFAQSGAGPPEGGNGRLQGGSARDGRRGVLA